MTGTHCKESTDGDLVVGAAGNVEGSLFLRPLEGINPGLVLREGDQSRPQLHVIPPPKPILYIGVRHLGRMVCANAIRGVLKAGRNQK